MCTSSTDRSVFVFFADRLKKRQSYQHESVMDTIMVSIDNLEESLKQRYKSLVVFIDNNSLPKDVSLNRQLHNILN